ncbi:MAG TPA: chemotaxis protein CheD [Gemmatimonadaceae bacterium]
MTDPCVPEIRVKVADLAASAAGTLITIGLGSCVAIALYDEGAAVGGLAHVLLPDETMSRDRTNLAKFPSTAIPMLLERMESLGARRERMWAKIAGGASMFGSLLPSGGINVGERNVSAVRDALSGVGMPILAEDTGGDYGRSVYFFVDEGRVEVRSLKKGARVL